MEKIKLFVIALLAAFLVSGAVVAQDSPVDKDCDCEKKCPGCDKVVVKEIIMPDKEELLGNQAFLGVESRTIEGDIARDYFSVKAGALIEVVADDSPAKGAGFKSGDVITKVGDESVTSTETLIKAVRKNNPGDKVKVEYYRKGKKATVEVTLAERKLPVLGKAGDWQSKRIFLDKEYDIDVDAIHEAVKEALEKAKINLRDVNDDLRIEMNKLKEELNQLKKELKENKKDKPSEKTKP